MILVLSETRALNWNINVICLCIYSRNICPNILWQIVQIHSNQQQLPWFNANPVHPCAVTTVGYHYNAVNQNTYEIRTSVRLTISLQQTHPMGEILDLNQISSNIFQWRFIWKYIWKCGLQMVALGTNELTWHCMERPQPASPLVRLCVLAALQLVCIW